MKQYDNYADLITFTRASSATYLDSDGILKTASTNEPRIEYDSDGNRLGLLVEEARTNLVTYSEDFSQWVNQASSDSVASDITAPDGTQNTIEIIEEASINYHSVYIVFGAASANWTVSVYIKQKNLGRYIQLRPFGLGSDVAWVTFDPSDGSVYESGGAYLVNTDSQFIGDGWYRVSMTCSESLLSGDGIQFSITDGTSGELPVYTGDGTSGVYVWGAQLEAGSFPTSYIPTSGSTATRSSDVATIGVSEFGYNSSEGTVFVDFNASGWFNQPNDGNFSRVFEFGGNTGSNADGIFRDPVSNSVRYRFNEDDGTTPAIGAANLSLVSSGGDKVAVSLKSGDNAIVMNGGTVAYGSGSAATNLYNLIYFGKRVDGLYLNGHIKSLRYYPRRLTNSQLQELTS